ncbi:MAG: hypothetical protein V4553_05640 [Bacteroidota bacterium]
MLQINASLAKHNEKIWCTYRTQHLFKFDSKSYIVELNNSFEPISVKKLKTENNNTAFEDVRLFSAGKSLLAFYTYFPFKPEGGWLWQFGVGFGIVNEEKGIIEKQLSLRPFAKREHEKNWSPYIFNDELFMITDYDPHVRVIKLGTLDEPYNIQEYYNSSVKTIGWKYGELRGGTPLLQHPNRNDGWLYGFIHSYLNNNNGFKRYYYYTAVRFNHLTKIIEYYPQPLSYEDETPDEEYELLWKYSNQRSIKVIFPIGIIHQNDGVVVSFGKDDVASFTQHFNWDFIDNLFT